MAKVTYDFNNQTTKAITLDVLKSLRGWNGITLWGDNESLWVLAPKEVMDAKSIAFDDDMPVCARTYVVHTEGKEDETRDQPCFVMVPKHLFDAWKTAANDKKAEALNDMVSAIIYPAFTSFKSRVDRDTRGIILQGCCSGAASLKEIYDFAKEHRNDTFKYVVLERGWSRTACFRLA